MVTIIETHTTLNFKTLQSSKVNLTFKMYCNKNLLRWRMETNDHSVVLKYDITEEVNCVLFL